MRRGDARARDVHLRLSEAEMAIVRQLASERGVSQAQLFRELVARAGRQGFARAVAATSTEEGDFDLAPLAQRVEALHTRLGGFEKATVELLQKEIAPPVQQTQRLERDILTVLSELMRTAMRIFYVVEAIAKYDPQEEAVRTRARQRFGDYEQQRAQQSAQSES